MANDLTQVAPILVAQGLLALRENAVMPRIVNMDYETEAKKENQKVTVPIPSAIAAQSVTAAATPPSTSDVAPTDAEVTLNQWYEAPFYMTDKDMAQAGSGTIPIQASEAIKALGNNIDNYCHSLYVGIYGTAGAAGTTPFASTIAEATDARKMLNKQLAPLSDRRLVLDPDAEANFLGLGAILQADQRGDTGGIIEGSMGRKLGFDCFMSQNVTEHTTGAVGTILVDDAGAVAVGVTSIHMDGFTTKASVGDIFTIAGDAQEYVVTAASDLAGTDSDVSFLPALKVALPDADTNEAVTFVASHIVNLAMHRDAIALATRPLLDVGGNLGNIIQSATDPVTGLTLRLEISREHKRTRFSYDILYGATLVRPDLAVRLMGA